MNIVVYIIASLVLAVIALLMLRLRLRLYLLSDRKTLFAGLGRTGIEIDLSEKKGRAQLFGLRLSDFSLVQNRTVKTITRLSFKPFSIFRITKVPRERKLLIRTVAQRSLKPLFSWLVKLLRATRFEELRGDIRAGFDSPDLTGQTYGYYNALIGAVPALNGRLNYYPDWVSSSFNGELRASLALPFYSLVGRTLQLIARLPLRKIIILAIGTKKVGDPHAE